VLKSIAQFVRVSEASSIAPIESTVFIFRIFPRLLRLSPRQVAGAGSLTRTLSRVPHVRAWGNCSQGRTFADGKLLILLETRSAETEILTAFHFNPRQNLDKSKTVAGMGARKWLEC